MILVITSDLILAQRIADAVEQGPKAYIVNMPPPTEKLRADVASGLRHEVYKAKPSVIVADARFGGNSYEIATDIPKLLRTGAALIALIPFESRKARDGFAEMGCFDVLVIGRRPFFRELSQSVTEAETAYLAGALGPPSFARRVLH